MECASENYFLHLEDQDVDFPYPECINKETYEGCKVLG